MFFVGDLIWIPFFLALAFVEGVLLVKGIREDPELSADEIAREIKSCISKRDRDEHVVHFLRVLNCRRDLFAILSSLLEESPSMFSLSSLVVKDSVFAAKSLKRVLLASMSTLARISIQDVIITFILLIVIGHVRERSSFC